MAKVVFGGGLFVLEAVTSGLTISVAGGEWTITPGGMVLLMVGMVPTAMVIANSVFGAGDGSPGESSPS